MSNTGSAEAEQHRNIRQAEQAWQKKASLRSVYGGLYAALKSRIPADGKILEIGAGSGHSRDFFSGMDITRLDILPGPWVDMVADAHDIPVPDESFDAIVMLDVLHHLADLPKFFAEVCRILRPGGRCVMIDPGITPISGAFYRAFHEEPVDMSVDPMTRQSYGPNKDPFDSNQALPTLLFAVRRYREQFQQQFPDLKVVETRRISLFAYPMSGGFQPWSLLSGSTARALLKLESVLEPVLGRLMAFRILATIQKR
ncbi:MAG: class I SAM-dependent methyltransferase [Burkholderiales bacterium]|nr:MAG: class I SAM-dependent methyltransferase [Burkholderiales bacterium]